MDNTGDPAIDALLRLEAEVTALRMICGFLIASNQQALDALSTVEKRIDDLTLTAPLTEFQRQCLAEALGQVLAHARSARVAFDLPGTAARG